MGVRVVLVVTYMYMISACRYQSSFIHSSVRDSLNHDIVPPIIEGIG